MMYNNEHYYFLGMHGGWWIFYTDGCYLNNLVDKSVHMTKVNYNCLANIY